MLWYRKFMVRAIGVPFGGLAASVTQNDTQSASAAGYER